MDHLNQLFNHAGYRNELICAEIVGLVNQLLNIYKTTDSLVDQQYIFAKFKEILEISRDQKMYDIRKIILQAIAEITTV